MTSEVIGEGTYGCVLKPSLTCKDKNISYKNKISKWMLSDSAVKEVQEYTLVGKADKKNEFYTGQPIQCKLKEDDSTWNAISKCKLMTTKFKNKTRKQVVDGSSLLIIGDGGSDLEKWIKIYNKMKVKPEIETFWKDAIRLFRGIQVFQQYDLIHHDIKPQNVVYQIENRRLNYIDFGLMRSIKTEAAKCQDIKRCLANSHWNYPTEVFLMNRKLFDELTRQTREQRMNTFDVYMNSIKKKGDNLFVKAFYTLLKYVTITKSDKDRFYQQHKEGFRELILEPGNYDDFLKRVLSGFDVFGLGLTLMYVLVRVKSHMGMRTVNAMESLFFRMMTPNIYKRVSIGQALTEYEKIIREM